MKKLLKSEILKQLASEIKFSGNTLGAWSYAEALSIAETLGIYEK